MPAPDFDAEQPRSEHNRLYFHARPGEVFVAFLKLGLRSFGGPVAHLEYFREDLVEKRKWVTAEQYGNIVALCQFLPGPASSQVGFALGLLRGGSRGAFLAWFAFTMPSAILLTAFAFLLYAGGSIWTQGSPANLAVAGALAGLKAAAVAVVIHAIWSMSRTFTPDWKRRGIAVGAALLAFFLPTQIGQIAAIIFGVLLGVWILRRATFREAETLALPGKKLGIRSALVSLSVAVALFIGLPVAAAFTTDPLIGTADAFYRSGALVFGGGHVVLPLLAAEPFIAEHVPADTFMAGYAAAQAVPGPLFTFASFLGTEIAFSVGSGGPQTVWLPFTVSLVALVAVFLPGVLLVLAALPFWVKLQTVPKVQSAMAGANAAVVGILLAALVNPIIPAAITGWLTAVVAALSLVALLVLRAPAWLVVVLAAVLGALAAVLGAVV